MSSRGVGILTGFGRAHRPWVVALAWVTACGAAQAQVVQVISKNAVGNTPAWESTPVLGSDALGAFVAYTAQDLMGSTFGPGRIYVQRLKGGAPYGPPLLISDGMTDNQLPDADGGRIVYTAFDSSTSGRVLVYDTATGTTTPLSAAGPVREARINGTAVSWIEGTSGATSVTFWDLSWMGTGIEPFTIAGPTPPATNVEVGSRLVVWDERESGGRNVRAYDCPTGTRYLVAADPSWQQRLPTTYGDWIVWEAKDTSAPGPEAPIAILGVNVATGQRFTVANDGSQNINPFIDGNYVAYASNKGGDFDIYLYRLSDGETFRLTNEPGDQFLSKLRGNLVTYVDDQAGNLDVYVLAFTDALPVAVAGPDQSARPGTSVTLDGSASYDPSNRPLTYLWVVVSRPAGSVSEPYNPSAAETNIGVMASFVPDVPGDYVLSLVVTVEALAGLNISSLPDTLTISSANAAPVAEAGTDRSVIALGTTVTLDGGASYDLDGDPITSVWTLLSKPPGSAAALLEADTATPRFTADVQGEYRVELVVSDPWSSSLPDVVTVSFSNLPPVANAGLNQTVNVGETAFLDGRASSDPNGDSLAYRWSLVSSPSGSAAVVGSATSPIATLTADLPGTFVLSLVVNDGFVASAPSNVTVGALSRTTQVAQQVTNAISAFNLLDPRVFKNPNMQNALTSKLQAVLADIQAGLYADALNKLSNDILKKTDGCATGGRPDRNDWLDDCSIQSEVYPALSQAIALVSQAIGS